MTAYYNELDPKKAAWLRELIKQGHIAPGEVDERSIEDVRADDLRGFSQCHFFAGIGVWSYALRCAGWRDDRPVWTGSCPCQPFSAAGKRGGTSDERHLWPAWFHLIEICRPATVFGEQVASKDGLAWLDLVHADLEGQGYAVGCLDLCAAGFGAPHIRQRLYFVGSMEHPRTYRSQKSICDQKGTNRSNGVPADASKTRLLADAPECGSWTGLRDSGPGAERGIQLADRGELGDTIQPGLEGHSGDGTGRLRQEREVPEQDRPACAADVLNGGLANPDGRDPCTERLQRGREHRQQPEDRGPCNGFWSDAVWLPCRDGKARPTQPGIFPLAHGAAKGMVHSGDPGASFDPNGPTEARVLRLRGYGDAIVAPCAEEFIRACMEVSHD